MDYMLMRLYVKGQINSIVVTRHEQRFIRSSFHQSHPSRPSFLYVFHNAIFLTSSWPASATRSFPNIRGTAYGTLSLSILDTCPSHVSLLDSILLIIYSQYSHVTTYRHRHFSCFLISSFLVCCNLELPSNLQSHDISAIKIFSFVFLEFLIDISDQCSANRVHFMHSLTCQKIGAKRSKTCSFQKNRWQKKMQKPNRLKF